MLALYRQLMNPLTLEHDARDRVRIAAAFPEIDPAVSPHCLAMRKYLDGCPQRFMDTTAYQSYLTWIRDRDARDRHGLQRYLTAQASDLDRALLFLREVNAYNWHDLRFDPKDDLDLVRFVDQNIHPTYLRVIEGVLAPLTRPIAHFTRVDRKKKPEGLDIWQVVQELQGSGYGNLCAAYVNVIRNGIGHGGITYGQREIQYRDKKGNSEVYAVSDIVRLFDDLVDVCNGIAAALRIFYITSRDNGYVPPRELLLEELLEETRTPWWTVEGCVESVVQDMQQLVIYVRANTRDVQKAHWSAIQTGILAEYFAPGYDRYLLSLRSPRAWPGWAIFDGGLLRRLREQGADSFEQYKGVLVNDVVFYVPQPKLPRSLARLDTFYKSFKLGMPIALEQIRENFGRPRIKCRDAKIHRNGWGAVLNAEVVLDAVESEDWVTTIRKHRRTIVRAAHSAGRKRTHNIGLRMLPLGYAYVAVFRRDYRSRRLNGFGLSEDLVCTLRLQRIRRIKAPDILGSTVETRGKWRIAWNGAWLESSGQQLL